MADFEKVQMEYMRNNEFLREEYLLEKAYVQAANAKRRRFIFSVVSAIGFAPILFSQVFRLDGTFTYLSIASAGIALISLTFLYLQPEKSVNSFTEQNLSTELQEEFLSLRLRNRDFEFQNRELKSKIDKIIDQLQKGDGAGELFGKDEKERILARIQEKLESNALSEYQSKLQAMINERLRYKNQEELFSRVSSRLENEVQNLAKRGNINLILGMVTTLSGLGVLAYSVFNTPILATAVDIASHFIPRVSLVLLIEVFAYFFLKLYKQSLSEIKYFQNEITNIESKFLGLRLASEIGDSESIKAVVSALISTERNFVLSKEQTTVELERIKYDIDGNKDLTGMLNKVIDKIK